MEIRDTYIFVYLEDTFFAVWESDLSESLKVRRRRFKCRTCVPGGGGFVDFSLSLFLRQEGN